MSDINSRIARIEAILRANRVHEGDCAYFLERQKIRRSPDPGMPIYSKCDCWLSVESEVPKDAS